MRISLSLIFVWLPDGKEYTPSGQEAVPDGNREELSPFYLFVRSRLLRIDRRAVLARPIGMEGTGCLGRSDIHTHRCFLPSFISTIRFQETLVHSILIHTKDRTFLPIHEYRLCVRLRGG